MVEMSMIVEYEKQISHGIAIKISFKANMSPMYSLF